MWPPFRDKVAIVQFSYIFDIGFETAKLNISWREAPGRFLTAKTIKEETLLEIKLSTTPVKKPG